MARAPHSRVLGELTYPEISRYLRATSIICLPLGAIEQHGPHLPLNTDMVIAEELTRRIVARWGKKFDLWQMPALALGLSREHDWAPGTMSLTLASFIALLGDIGNEIVRSLPARNLLIVNAHGGNRGVLENLLRELQADCGINACVIHPFDLARSRTPPPHADVHGGMGETSVMLALAPALMRREQIAGLAPAADPAAIETLVLEPGTTWPWRSDDRRLAEHGVIGEARAASAAYGRKLIDDIVAQAGVVLQRLLENQALTPPAEPLTARGARAAPPAPPRRPRALPARTSSRSGNRPPPRTPGKS